MVRCLQGPGLSGAAEDRSHETPVTAATRNDFAKSVDREARVRCVATIVPTAVHD